MSDGAEQTQEAAETTQTDKAQTVTLEQFEASKQAQAGSDRKVGQLTTQVTDLLKKLQAIEEEKVASTKTSEERIAELETKAQKAESETIHERLKGAARGLLSEAKVQANDRLLERLVGSTPEETQDLVTAYIEGVKANSAESAKEYARSNGRTVDGPGAQAPTAFANLNEMTEEQLQDMDPLDIYRLTHAQTGA